MISVIIPVYNLEKYLEKCLDSLLCQKNKDFEIILVNDGSKDNSEDICKKYAEKDSRIKYFYQENKGVSKARNKGLEEVHGEWIAFVDGDDAVDEEYLTLPDDTDIDVIEKSYVITINGNIDYKNVIMENELIEGSDNIIKYYSRFIKGNSLSLWNKIIKRELLKEVKFDETKAMGEDFIFFLSIFYKIKKYFKFNKGLYTYIRRDNSASDTIDSNLKYRVKILFENLQSVRYITYNTGLRQLGDYIVYTIYYPYLLRLKRHLHATDWMRVIKLLALYPYFCNYLLDKGSGRRLIKDTLKNLFKD